ncbi:hypothetical protein OK074_6193 [Actinobacteria bacterium OK074]|nr:hypothetical protein OK074_6193 [Actinobacteria bacterium OK074]
MHEAAESAGQPGHPAASATGPKPKQQAHRPTGTPASNRHRALGRKPPHTFSTIRPNSSRPRSGTGPLRRTGPRRRSSPAAPCRRRRAPPGSSASRSACRRDAIRSSSACSMLSSSSLVHVVIGVAYGGVGLGRRGSGPPLVAEGEIADLGVVEGLAAEGVPGDVVALPQAGAEPLSLNVFSLILRGRSYAGSLIGGIRETQEMLDFCVEHGIGSEIEVIPADKINEAYERVLPPTSATASSSTSRRRPERRPRPSETTPYEGPRKSPRTGCREATGRAPSPANRPWPRSARSAVLRRRRRSGTGSCS